MGNFKKKKIKFWSSNQIADVSKTQKPFLKNDVNFADLHTEKVHDEVKLPSLIKREIPSLDNITDDVKKFINTKLDHNNSIHLKKVNQVMDMYKKPQGFGVPRKLGDRSYCPCLTCEAKHPKRVAMASFSQNQDSYVLPGIKLYSPGVSCASNALSAVLYSTMKKASLWNEDDMNRIMIAGDRMHAVTQGELNVPRTTMLYLDDLIRDVNIYNKKISLKDTGFPMGGNLFLRSDDFPSVDELIEKLKENDAKGMVIRYMAFCISILKQGDDVYLFDSHARNAYGMPGPNGCASLYKFKEASHIVPYLRRFITNYRGHFGVREEDEAFEYIMVRAKQM